MTAFPVDLSLWEGKKAHFRLRDGSSFVDTVKKNDGIYSSKGYPWRLVDNHTSYTTSGYYLRDCQNSFDIVAIELCPPDPDPAPTINLARWEGKQVFLHLRDGRKLCTSIKRNPCTPTVRMGYPWWVDGLGSLTLAGQYYVNGQESVNDIISIEEHIPAPTVDLSLWEDQLLRVRFRDGRVKGDVRIESVDGSSSYPWRLCPGDHILDRYTQSGHYYSHKPHSGDIVAIEPMLSDPKSEEPSRDLIRESLIHLETSALLIQRGLADLRKQLED